MALNNDVNDFIVGRLANFTNTAEGSFLPPQQKGQFRVPFVSNLRVTNTQTNINSTTFTLTWQDIISTVPSSQSLTVDHYNIYYNIPGDGTGQPIGPYTCKQSPALVTVNYVLQAPVTFIVQTVLTNGMTSELAASPTTSGFTNPYLINGDSIFVSGLTLTNNSPGAGQISWSSCTVNFNGQNFSVAAGSTSSFYVIWTVGANTFTGATLTSYIPAANIFMIATNQNGVADVAWNKVAGGGVHGGLINVGQVLDGPNGTLCVNISWTNSTPAGEVTWSAGTVNYQGNTYTIATGHTSATFFIYWQLSNPNVFQSSATSPSLGSNDFIVAYNVTNNSGTSGIYSPVEEIHDSNGDRVIMGSTFIVIYNSAGHFVADMGRANAAVSGITHLADGTGAGSLGQGVKIIQTGIDGKIQMATYEVNIANSPGANTWISFLNMGAATASAGTSGDVPAQTAGYIQVSVDGNIRKIPLYLP